MRLSLPAAFRLHPPAPVGLLSDAPARGRRCVRRTDRPRFVCSYSGISDRPHPVADVSAPGAGLFFLPRFGRVVVTAIFGFLLNVAAATEADGPLLLAPWIVEETSLQPKAPAPPASALLARDAWSGRAIATLADALGRVPGVIMLESHGGFEPPKLSLRGSGLQSAPVSRGIALLLDGLPLGLADGSFNVALFDPQLGATIAVQRGLDAWRAAPAALGGAFDLRSESNGASAWRIEAGSFGAWRARASTVLTRGDTRAHAALSFARQDGYRPLNTQERFAFAAGLRRALARGGEASVNLYHARPKYDIPGPLTLAAATVTPRSVSGDALRDRPSRESELWRAAAEFVSRHPEQELEAGLSFARTDDRFQQLQANGTSFSRSDDAALRVSLTHRFTIAGVQQQARVTAHATRGWRELRRFRNDSGTVGALFGRDGLSATTSSLALEDQIALTRSISATLAVARVAARRDIVDRLEPAHTTQRLGLGTTVPQATVRWMPGHDLAFYGGVSRAVEPPTFDDLLLVSGAYPNLSRRSQVLRNQCATTWELGARGQRAALAWDLTGYRADWTDEILRLADAKGSALGAVNASPTRHAGVEASARWRLLNGANRLTLAVNATWTQFVFAHDAVFGRNRLAGMPPFLGSAELLLERAGGMFGAVGLDHTDGRTPVDHAGRMTYGGRTLAHVRAGWRTSQGWTTFVEVRNIFDRRSIASTAGVLDLVRNPAATAIFLPGLGRSLTIGLEWKQ